MFEIFNNREYKKGGEGAWKYDDKEIKIFRREERGYFRKE